MARLPVNGGDNGSWGSILNDFLLQSLDNDGALKASALSIAGAEMSANKGQPSGYAPLDGTGKVPAANLPAASGGTVPDANGSTKGILKLAGDLGGSADTPSVPALAGKINASVVTAKGDLLASTAASTVTRLPIGSDGQVLTADSSQGVGIKWATPAPPTPLVVNLGNQSAGTVNLNMQGYMDVYFKVTLTQSVIFTVSNAAVGASFTLVVAQDGTGGHTSVTWPTGNIWSGGTDGTLSSGANAIDCFTFLVTAVSSGTPTQLLSHTVGQAYA